VRAKLIVWLALAVVFTTVQCVSACTIEACSKTENLPPCHKHHDSKQSEPCSHQAVLANGYALPPAGIAPPPMPAVGVAAPLPVGFALVFANVSRPDGVSPPGVNPLHTIILRI